MDGVYMLTGDKFRSCRLDADIVDIMSTMYQAMDIALPERTDGEVLTGAFSTSVSKNRQMYSYDPNFMSSSNGNDELRGRLEDLGYL